MLMYLFNVHVGMTFSGGLIDLAVYGILPGDEFTSWIRILLVGIFHHCTTLFPICDSTF